MFTRQSSNGFIVILVYEDDILIGGDSLDEFVDIRKALHQAFIVKDIGDICFFLRIEICCLYDGFLLN